MAFGPEALEVQDDLETVPGVGNHQDWHNGRLAVLAPLVQDSQSLRVCITFGHARLGRSPDAAQGCVACLTVAIIAAHQYGPLLRGIHELLPSCAVEKELPSPIVVFAVCSPSEFGRDLLVQERDPEPGAPNLPLLGIETSEANLCDARNVEYSVWGILRAETAYHDGDNRGHTAELSNGGFCAPRPPNSRSSVGSAQVRGL